MNATMSPETVTHYPVMLNQVLSIITPQHGGTFIDCTFGGGGYSEAILKFPKTKVIALDRDSASKKFAKRLSEKFPNRFLFFHEKFSNLNKVIEKGTKPKAIIFDLGFSNYQISDLSRGFSFNSSSQLDMRMGLNNISAYDAINKLSKDNLFEIFKFLGEERDAKKIANRIQRYKFSKKIKFTNELSNLIKSAKSPLKNFKINPCTKTFQALRIFVNKELTELTKGLVLSSKILEKNCLLVVVSFHSLEDRIVKTFLNFYSKSNENISRYLPTKENEENNSTYSIPKKKPIKPEVKEILENPNSRSAKLRYAIRNENKFVEKKDFEKRFGKLFDLEKLMT